MTKRNGIRCGPNAHRRNLSADRPSVIRDNTNAFDPARLSLRSTHVSQIARVFTENDDTPLGAHPYAVLSYGWWQSKFAANPSAIGRTIRVNGSPVTIVGVAQPGFEGMEPGLPASIFIELSIAPAVRPGFND